MPAIPEYERPVPGTGDRVLGYECMLCGKEATVTLTGTQYRTWRDWAGGSGPHLQNALPELSPGVRETLLSGSHDGCFDEAFPDDDE